MSVTTSVPNFAGQAEIAETFGGLTELTDGATEFFYGCYEASPSFGGILRANRANLAYTKANFPNDGQHRTPVDMVYSPARDRLYVLFRNADEQRLVVSEVNPTTLAMVDFVNIAGAGYQPGFGSITEDGTNLYVATFITNPSGLIVIPYTTAVAAELMPFVGFTQARCIRHFDGKLFVAGKNPPSTHYVLRCSLTGTVEQSATFIGDEVEIAVDDIGESTGHIWVGNRDQTIAANQGVIRKFSKTNLSSVELVSTSQPSRCTIVKRTGNFIWSAFENGKAVRIDPISGEKRTYTLSEGSGYHGEFAGTDDVVCTYNNSRSKISRYHFPQQAWMKKFGGTGIDSGRAMGRASNGNLIVAGSFDGIVDFTGDGSGSAGNGLLTSTDGGQMFLAEYSQNGGVHQWSRNRGSFSTSVRCLSVDASGNIFVGGAFYGTANFGGTNRTSLGDSDCFLVKYDSSGNYLWDIVFGQNGTDTILSLAIDPSGNVIVSGYLQATGSAVDIRGTDNNGRLIFPQSGQSSFLAKFTSNGAYVFAKGFFANGDTQGVGLAADASGNIFLLSYINNDIDFGSGAVPRGGCIAKFLPDSTLTFVPVAGFTGGARSFGVDSQVSAIKIDSAGDLIITGSIFCPNIQGAKTCRCNLGNGIVQAVGSDPFIVKYQASDYAWQWQALIQGLRPAIINAIALDNQTQTMLATGFFNGTKDFGGISKTAVANTGDGYLAKYSNAGALRWVEQLAGTAIADVRSESVAIDGGGNPVVTGKFTASLTVTGRPPLTGTQDIFLISFPP